MGKSGFKDKHFVHNLTSTSKPALVETLMRIKDGDINHLRIWGRRPACRMRYDHGGYNSSFPMNEHTVLFQILIQQLEAELTAKETERRRLSGPPARRSNILRFPARPTPEIKSNS